MPRRVGLVGLQRVPNVDAIHRQRPGALHGRTGQPGESSVPAPVNSQHRPLGQHRVSTETAVRRVARLLRAETHQSTACMRPNHSGAASENGVRLAQKMQVGPCIPVIIQLQKAEVGPTSGPTWRLSHLDFGLAARSARTQHRACPPLRAPTAAQNSAAFRGRPDSIVCFNVVSVTVNVDASQHKRSRLALG